MKIIVNADDFGLSYGVNRAIYQGLDSGVIHTTSLMVSAPCVQEAVQMTHQLTEVQIGLHFNLTIGKACLSPDEIPLLVDSQGVFKNGFLKLVLLSYLHPVEFKKQVQKELTAQFNKMASFQIPISHIDGHRHIQMIPAVFKLVHQLAQAHGIPRIRIINDSFFMTLLSRGDFHWIWDGGFIKWGLLRFFYILNHTKSKVYFYSILHTGRMFKQNVAHIRVPQKYEAIEIMIHPAETQYDESPYPYPNPLDREAERRDASFIKVFKK